MRVAGFFTGRVASDGARYAVMAESFLANGEFIMPLGEYWSESWAPAYSHHYSPAYPIFLAPFIAIGGLSPWSIKLGSTLSGLLFVPIAFWTTQNLYGRDKALLVSAAVSMDPVLIHAGSIGFSENLVAIFFTLTIWAILKSLQHERYVILAGLFAGLAYLSKSGIGWFFLIAGLAGFAWRFHYMRWRVFRNRHYLLAIVVFGSLVALWSVRNLLHFWDGSALGLLSAWQSSEPFARATGLAVSRPQDLAFILAARLPFYVALFLFIGVYWLGHLKRTFKRSDEHSSGLWLAVLLTY